jgi:hypothetical protein
MTGCFQCDNGTLVCSCGRYTQQEDNIVRKVSTFSQENEMKKEHYTAAYHTARSLFDTGEQTISLSMITTESGSIDASLHPGFGDYHLVVMHGEHPNVHELVLNPYEDVATARQLADMLNAWADSMENRGLHLPEPPISLNTP